MTIEKVTVGDEGVARLEELLDEGHHFAYTSQNDYLTFEFDK